MNDDTRTLSAIESILGRFNDAGRQALLDAIAENPQGCITLAQRVAARNGVNNPPGLYLSCIAGGEHLEQPKRGATDKRTSPADAFRRLFTVKVAHLRENTDLSEHHLVEEALDYAVGNVDRCQVTAYATGQSALTLEADMRRTLNRPRHDSGEQGRREISRQWQRIVLSLHDERINAMYHALRDTCANPQAPSDDEGARTREALIAEIDELGIEPRRPPGLVFDFLDEFEAPLPGEPVNGAASRANPRAQETAQ